MKPRYPIDPDDPFGSRPDEKPPQGWDERLFEQVRRRIEDQRDDPGAGRLPDPPRRGRRYVRVLHVAMMLLLAAAVVVMIEDLSRQTITTPADASRTFVLVNGSGEPDVAVEWARVEGSESGYVVLQSIDPEVSYVLIDPRLSAE